MKTLILFIVSLSSLSLAQNFWEAANGPYGGMVYASAINSDGVIFTGNMYNGVSRSTDNGGSWTVVNNGLTASTIYSIALNSDGDVFAGTYQHGIFRSTDSGDNWTEINNGIPAGRNVSAIVVTGNGSVFIGTSLNDIFRSTDNGDTWMQCYDGNNTFEFFALLVNSQNYVFAGTGGGGVIRSTDNGDTWTNVGSGLPTFVYSLARELNDDLFAGTYNGVYYSSNNGTNWTLRNTGLENTDVRALGVSHDNYLFAGTGFDGMRRSTDNGLSWSVINSGLTEFTSVRTLSVSPDNKIFAGSNYGAFLSENNGDVWIDINSNLLNTYVNILSADSLDNLYAAVWAGGIYRSTDNGENWDPKNNGLSSATVYCMAEKPGYVFAGTYSGIFRTTDEGESWTDCTNGLGSWDIESIAIDSSGQVLVGTYTNTSNNGVFRSTDNGDSWTYVGLNNNTIYSLAAVSTNNLIAGVYGGVFISPDNGTNWYFYYIYGMPYYSVVNHLAVTPDNYIFAGTDFGIYRSSNFGAGWNQVGTGVINTNTIRALAVNPEGYIFVSTAVGVFESTDNGSSWIDIHDSIVNSNVRSLTSNSDGYIFAGTNGRGVSRSISSTLPLPGQPALLSPENGSIVNSDTVLCKWTVCAPAVTNYRLEHATDSLFTTNILVDSTITGTSTVIRGLDGNTTYWWRVSAKNGAGWGEYSTPRLFKVIITETNKTQRVPSDFELMQNYPNPFNPSTKIKYSVPQSSDVVIKVFDILGNEIRTLVNEEKSSGTYKITWNAANLPSGIYFYQLRAGDFTQTKKMILLK